MNASKEPFCWSVKLFKLLNKKPIIPSDKEIALNPPSRSAKLRYAIKINDNHNFEVFLKKFENLINIENLYLNLWKKEYSFF